VKEFVFDHYYLYSEITEMLQCLAEEKPDIISYENICTTLEGREMWAVTITNTKSGDALSKPAYYVDGNHHAGEVTGSMAVVAFIYKLVSGYGVDANITNLLDTTTVYAIPRLSPDGADCYLTSFEKMRSVNRPYPFEKPAPGLHPKDMDGDGVIRLMRIECADGAWKTMPKDPRVMIKRQPADFGGTYYNVYPEGYIEDFDGVHIQPAEGKWNRDFNRNYPFGWFPENRQPGAGEYPLCNPENKAVVDFVLSHPNICSGVTFHTSGGCYIYPPGTKPSKDAFAKDMKMFQEIGAMATEETGYECFNIFDGFLTDTVNYSSGAFDDWMYQAQGIPTYTAELWDLLKRAGVPDVYPRTEPITDMEQAERMYQVYKWIDANVKPTENWIPNKDWTEFEHPQLGKVEIGSIDYKYTWQNCPPGFLEAEVDKNANFCVRMAMTVPRLQISDIDVKQVGTDGECGIYQVSVMAANVGYMPTYVCQEAKKLKVDKSLLMKVNVDGTLLMGDAVSEIGHLEGFSGINTFYNYDNIITAEHDPTKKVFTYMVAAKPGSEFTVWVGNDKSGSASKTVTL